jgi:DNA-binding MarR family transcriptional regulator
MVRFFLIVRFWKMEIRREIIDGILRVDSIIRNIDKYNSDNSKYKLSLLEIRTLLFIKENKNVKPIDLVNEFHVTAATVTVQIDRLVKKGFLERVTDQEDARSVNLKFTKLAEEKLDEIIKDRLNSYDVIFKDLSIDDQKQLLVLLEKLHNMVEDNRKNGIL